MSVYVQSVLGLIWDCECNPYPTPLAISTKLLCIHVVRGFAVERVLA